MRTNCSSVEIQMSRCGSSMMNGMVASAATTGTNRSPSRYPAERLSDSQIRPARSWSIEAVRSGNGAATI